MQRMKKSLSIVLSMIMLFSFTSCGESGESKSDKNNVTESVQQQSGETNTEIEVPETKSEQEAEQQRQFADEELARIYSYGILKEEMFDDLDQIATGKD